jgi:hypothetical protein
MRRMLIGLIGVMALAVSSHAIPAEGPLRVNPDNPRYFTAGRKIAGGRFISVYLTGSHTWNNLVDMTGDDPKAPRLGKDELPFSYERFLENAGLYGHNFIRLWAWDSTVWDTGANEGLGKKYLHRVSPQPWLRTGPGDALDGKPKFDLTKFNPAYFERLRQRVGDANDKGVYVSVMLFEGWGLTHGNRRQTAASDGWAWRTHPFNPANNVNGLTIDGADELSGRVHVLGNRRINDLQAAYVRKVIDTVNDLDNVLYEVINEGGQKDWDWWVVRTVKEYEKAKPKQHPVGLTGHGAERLADMLASPADWVSPGRADGYAEDPPPWDAKHGKVSILDTDHVWGVGGSTDWVWKAFTRGHNPIFMDPYDGFVLDKPGEQERWDAVRYALGRTRQFEEAVALSNVAPLPDLASSGYCLADPGREYIVYLPKGDTVTVDLTAATGPLVVQWLEADANNLQDGGQVAGGARRELKSPIKGPAVVHLKVQPAK